MKKILTGLAAGALALGVAVPASAGGPDSVYDILADSSSTLELLLDSAGLDEALGDCGATGNNNGLPDYTVFIPGGVIGIDNYLGAVLDNLELTLGQLAAQPALIKALLLNHVVKSNISPSQLEDNSNTVFNTMGGLTLVKAYNPVVGYTINNLALDTNGSEDCNGWVYEIEGVLAPVTAQPTNGTTTDGSGAAGGSGEGLPATGSESMALTYAALASLIAGAGVLVIRRRSVA
jgi:LPXTG-motif cell wall-anchored protein